MATDFLNNIVTVPSTYTESNILDVVTRVAPARTKANDFIDILRDIRGTADDLILAAQDPNCIYGELVIKYNDFITKYGDLGNAVGPLQAISAEIIAVAAMQTEIVSIYTDKLVLDSIYADKATLDSIYADKLILDSIYADKLVLDNIYADRLALNSIYMDKTILDSIYADKVILDSIYADKAILTSIYTDKLVLDSLYADKITLDRLYTSIANIDIAALSITNIDTVAASIADVNTVATNIIDVNTVATISADVSTVAANIADVTNFADVYYGPLALDPTLRNDGSAMVIGDMYFNTTINRLKIYEATGWVVNHIALSELFVENAIGNPVGLSTFDEVYNHLYSSGIVNGCDITDNLNGTINISAGEVVIRAPGDTGHGTLYTGSVAGATNLTLVDGQPNYVYVSYNDGITLTIAVSQLPAAVNMIDTVPAYVIVREGTQLSYLDVRSQNVDHIGKNQVKEFYTDPFARKNGGSVLSNAGTLHIACTAGGFYFQLNEYAVPALDTTGVDTFEYYKHVAGAWVETDASTIDPNFYDNGTDLVAVTNNRYTTHWVYAITGNNPHYAVLYGNASYANIADAQAASAPSVLPTSVATLGVLLGRVIAQEGNAEIVSVASAFKTTFTSTLASDHENLAGLLGGAVGDHVHLTTAEHRKLTAIEAEATADQTGAEIKALYEAELDTNAYTDAEQTKLAGIEVGATADQTASEIKIAYESNADTNEFSDAEQTKLANIDTDIQTVAVANAIAMSIALG